MLASELTRDRETLAYFPDGVFWLHLGERPDIVTAQRQLAIWLGGDPESIRSPFEGAKLLAELVGDKQCLVVLDDVWSVGAAQALAVTGPQGRVLITTRDKLVLERIGATTFSLDVLTPADARALLAQLTATVPSQLPPDAERVLDATGPCGPGGGSRGGGGWTGTPELGPRRCQPR